MPSPLPTTALLALLIVSSLRATEPDLAPVKEWIAHGAEVKSVHATFEQERQLRSVKRPLVSTGVFRFAAPSSFRWELGNPAQTIAVRDGEGPLLVLRPSKKVAYRYRAEDLAVAGPRGGAAFLTAGFPRDFDSFTRTFTVTEVERTDDTLVITARLNDRRAALAMRKIVFTIDAASNQPRSVYLRFRDSSSITTRFTEVKENAAIDPSVFTTKLDGYEVEDAKP